RPHHRVRSAQEGPMASDTTGRVEAPASEELVTDVLVVGAGPTGLMAGQVLARRGIEALVIDEKSGPTRQSRALALQARSMEIYDQLGLAPMVLEHATAATRIQVGAAGAARGVD